MYVVERGFMRAHMSNRIIILKINLKFQFFNEEKLVIILQDPYGE